MNARGSPAAEHVPERCGKSTHEHELDESECENFNRNGRHGVLHMDFYHATAELTISMQSGIANPCALFAPRHLITNKHGHGSSDSWSFPISKPEGDLPYEPEDKECGKEHTVYQISRKIDISGDPSGLLDVDDSMIDAALSFSSLSQSS